MSVSVGACAVMSGSKELGLVGCYCETMLGGEALSVACFGVADGATCCV